MIIILAHKLLSFQVWAKFQHLTSIAENASVPRTQEVGFSLTGPADHRLCYFGPDLIHCISHLSIMTDFMYTEYLMT